MHLADLGAVTTFLGSNSFQTKEIGERVIELAAREGILTAQQKALALSTLEVSGAEGIAAGETSKLALAFKGLWAAIAANPLPAVVIALTAVTVAVAKARKNAVEAAKDASDKAITAAKEAQQEQEKVEDLYQAYQEANDTYQKDKSKKNELVAATDNLLQALGEEGRQIRDLKKDYTELGEEIDGVINKKRIDAIIKLNDAVDKQRNAIQTMFGTASQFTSGFSGVEYSINDDVENRLAGIIGQAVESAVIGGISESVNANISYYGAGATRDSGTRQLNIGQFRSPEQRYQDLIAASDAMMAAVEEKIFNIDEVRESSIYQYIQKQIEELQPEIEKLNGLIGETNAAAVRQLYREYTKDHELPESIEQFNEFRKSLLGEAGTTGYFTGASEDIKKAIDTYLASLSEFDKFVGFGKFKEEFKSLDKTVQTAVKNLIKSGDHLTEEQGKALKKWADDYGYSIDDIIKYVSRLDSVEIHNNPTLANIADLGTLRDELAQTSKAWEEYNKTLEGGDRGDAANQMAQAYQKAMEDIENGRIDTKAVWGAAKLLFSDQQLAEWKYDLTRIAQELSGPMMQALFSGGEDDDTEIGVKFANYIKEHAAELESAGAHILDQGNGKFQFWYDSLGKLAQSLGMSEEAVTSLLDALDAYGVQSMQSGEDITKLADQFREIRNNSLTAKDAVREFIQAMATGDNALNEHEIIENLKALKENGVITGNDYDFSMMIKEVFDELNKVDNAEADATVKLDDQATPAADPIRQHLEEIFAEPIEQEVVLKPSPKSHSTHSYARADYLHDAGVSIDPEQIVAEHAASFESSGKTRRQNIETHETVTVTVGADITPAEESIGALHEGLKGVDETEVSAEAGLDTDPAYDNLNGLVNDLNDFASTDVHKTVYIDYYDNDQTSGETASGSTGSHHSGSFASGTKNAPGGPTLVNELGPELISDNGEAFIANGGKPGFVNLGKGAIVFTADETKEIFRKEYSNVPVRAYADGTPNRASLRDRLIRGERTQSFSSGYYYHNCANCGKSISSADNPCPKCGKDPWTKETPAPTKQSSQSNHKTCPNCGAWCSTGTIVCGQCGYNFNTGQMDNDYYVPYVPDESYTYNPVPSNGGYYYHNCANCGKSISSADNPCPYCGKDAWNKEQSHTSKQSVDTSKYKGTQSTSQAAPGGSSGYSGSSNYPGAADYASETEPERVDWIAVLLNRIQKTISSLEKIASSGFKSLATRTDAATKEISELYRQIDAEDAGYARYMQEANAVGLSADIVDKIKNGTIDIQEYDNDTRALIDRFSEWYDTCHFMRQRIMTIVFNCWNTLRAFQLQHEDEICLSANA